MSRPSTTLLAAVLPGIAAVCGPTIATAQTGAEAPPSTSAPSQSPSEPISQSGLEDIVVVAQRRAENQQSVPIAVTSVTASLAEKIGINEPQAIAQIVPGLTLNRSAASAVPFLRGIGTPSSTIGNEPSVATFIDDIYISNGAAAFFEFNNILQIEVLKGPQGTLFGRNATGGVIHVRTKNPTHDTTADFAASYGNYSTYGAQAYASTGLTNSIAMNISAYAKREDDGWGRSVVTGNDSYDGWGWGVRSKLLFDSGGATTFLLNGNYEKRRGSQGLGGRVVPGTFGRGGYSPDANGAGFYDITSSFDQYFENSIAQISGKLTHDFGIATLVSISSYTSIKSDGEYDIDVAPVPFFGAAIVQQGRTFTQELQLISPDGAPVSWLLGAFYLHDDATFDTVYSGQAFGAAGVANVNDGQKTSSISGFAQATSEILPRTNLTLGVRYTSDRRKFAGSTGVGPVRFPAGSVELTDARTFANLTGRASLDYRFSNDVLGYVAYNRGFKSGIFNLGGLNPGASRPPAAAEPENLNAYSVGFKSEWFDHRLRINAEAYYYDYKDIQVATLLVGTQVITNAGAAKLKGIDIEIAAVPIEGLTINGSVSLEHGEYTSFPGGPQNLPLPPNTPVQVPANGQCVIGANPVPPYPTGTAPLVVASCDLRGNDTVNTPALATSLGFVYSFDAGSIPIDIAASWSHKGKYYFEADNNPGVRQAPTDIINASVLLHSPDEKFDIRFWVNNLTREKYYTYITQSGTSGTKYSPAPPRTYGITIGAHF